MIDPLIHKPGDFETVMEVCSELRVMLEVTLIAGTESLDLPAVREKVLALDRRMETLACNAPQTEVQ